MRPSKLFFTLLMVSMTWTGQWAVAGETRTRKLSLEQCIRLAIESNPDIKSALLDLRAAEATLKTSESPFDPYLTSSLKYDRSTRRDFLTEGILDMFNPNEAHKEIFSQQGASVQLGLNKYFSTGTRAILTFQHGWDEYETFVMRETEPGLYEPGKGYKSIWTTDLRLTLSQSLLKGLGLDANLAGLRAARALRDQAYLNKSAKVNNVVAAVVRAYWNLVLRKQELEIRKANLESALEQERAAKASVEVGNLPELALYQASTAVASREELVLLAETALKEASARLALLLEQPTDVLLVPVDEPYTQVQTHDEARLVKAAMETNPMLKAAKQDLERRKHLLESARDRTLPDLSLFGTVGTTAYANMRKGTKGGDDYSDSWKDLFDQDGLNYGAGLLFSYPLGNDAAEGELERTTAEYKKALVRVKQLEDNIKKQVESSVRAIGSAKTRLEVTAKSKEYAQKRLEAEKEAYDLGRNTMRDLLEAQDVLQNALLSELRAKVDLATAWVTLMELTGDLAERMKVVSK